MVLIALFAVAWCYELVRGTPPLNAAGVPIGGDYIAFHTAGRLLLDGQGSRLYDHDAVVRIQDQLLGGRIPGFYDAFRNPPFAALPFVPLAALDLIPGFAVWTLISIGCLALALRLLLDDLPELKHRWRGITLLVLAFAPVYFGVIDGENATVSLLLYVLIYRSLVRGDGAAAGIWAGLGLFKPQLFFVFPIVFLVTGRWRALAAYVASAVALALVSLALVGVSGIEAWARVLIEPESKNALANAWRMASLKSFFDLVLIDRARLAATLYIASSAVLLCGVVVAWSKQLGTVQARWIYTSLAAVLIDPHLVDYDLTVLVPAGVLAGVRIPRIRPALAVMYLIVVTRAQVPLGYGALQVTVLGFASLALYVLLASIIRQTLPSPLPVVLSRVLRGS